MLNEIPKLSHLPRDGVRLSYVAKFSVGQVREQKEIHQNYGGKERGMITKSEELTQMSVFSKHSKMMCSNLI